MLIETLFREYVEDLSTRFISTAFRLHKKKIGIRCKKKLEIIQFVCSGTIRSQPNFPSNHSKIAGFRLRKIFFKTDLKKRASSPIQ